MVKCLELFCGTKSFKKACPDDWEIISVDILKKFDPDICCDILDLDYKTLWEVGEFDIIWLSPPCRYFSTMLDTWLGRPLKRLGGKILTREQRVLDEINLGLPPVHKGLEIVDYLKPKYWFMENPASGGTLHKYITDRNKIQVDYSAFGFDYRKRTNIWTNRNDLKNKLTPHNVYHKTRIGKNSVGKSTSSDRSIGLLERYSIPPKLFDYLLDGCVF